MSIILLRRRILKLTPEALWVFTGQVGIAIAGLVGIKLLTHILDPSEFGRLALANTIVAFIGTSFFGPFAQGLMRFWAISKDRGNLKEFYAISSRLAKYISLVVFLITAMASTLIIWIAHKFDWTILVILSLAIGVIMGNFNLMLSVFKAARQRRRVAILNSSNAFLRPMIATLVVILIIAKAHIALLGYLIAVLFVFLVTQRIYSQMVSEISLHHLKPKSRELLFEGLSKEILSYSLPFLVWGIFGWIHISCDRWSLQTFYGSEVVGAFAVVSLLSMYPLIFGSGFLSSLFAPIAFQKGGDLSLSHKVASANKILMAMTGIYIIGAIVLIGFFAVFHQSLVLLISNISFIRYSHLLPWLTLAWALFFLGQMFSTFGLLANQPQIYIMPKLVSSVVAVSSTFYLSFKIGPIGVVLGLMLAGFIYVLWCGIIVLRLVRRGREPLLL